MLENHISIHASAREATDRYDYDSCVYAIFQSTPPRGRRQFLIVFLGFLFYFNPRLREGGDWEGSAAWEDHGDFNPRLREGGDLIFSTTAI